MATPIESLSERRVGGPRKYPWDTWQDGQAWRIRRGEDFETSPTSMAGSIRKYAERYGLRVRAHVFVDAVEFQFSTLETSAAAAA